MEIGAPSGDEGRDTQGVEKEKECSGVPGVLGRELKGEVMGDAKIPIGELGLLWLLWLSILRMYWGLV